MPTAAMSLGEPLPAAEPVVVVVGETPPHPAASNAIPLIAAATGMTLRMEYMVYASCDRHRIARSL